MTPTPDQLEECRKAFESNFAEDDTRQFIATPLWPDEHYAIGDYCYANVRQDWRKFQPAYFAGYQAGQREKEKS